MDYRLTIGIQEILGESIQPDPPHESLRFQVKIKSGTLHPRPGTFPEPDAQMGLIGSFIMAEADIPVEAENGLVNPRVGLHPWRAFFQLEAQGHYKIPGRNQNLLFIHLLVLVKPHFVVIMGKLAEKSNTLFGKSVKREG